MNNITFFIMLYLLINMAFVLIIVAIEEREYKAIFIYSIGMPFVLIFKAIYLFCTDWIFNIKAFFIFGKGYKPITVSESKILGKRNVDFPLCQRWFLMPTKEEKSEYVIIHEKARERFYE